MVDTLGHRGPDGHGVAVCAAAEHGPSAPEVVFGHTRLAILDLSSRGAQPMQSTTGPVWITFNGEIYNFTEIRGELERAGRTFRSGTDTEVILQGYEQWGAAVIDRLRGMFAFAIWDGRARRLLLARDRFGIKPLYLCQDASGIFFASELRALLATGVPPRRLDPIAAEQFLAYQTVAPPRTLIAGVTMLRAGEMIVAGDGPSTVQGHLYWDLLDAASPAARDASADDARSSVRRLLAESAALHLVSDVPIGVFLSGGIDSSAIVSLTAAAGITPRTFTVTLPGSTHDEAPFARAIASRFRADHHDIDIDAATLRRLLPMSLASTDHPSGDGFNTFVVSHAVSKAGFKVALSGLGGDELFGGYPSFRRLQRLRAYAPILR